MKYKEQNESGRSMVEMLGVLAIVGVISIGGIAGYNYGMNRYRTNEVLDGANKRAYTVATQKTLGIPLNLSEFSNDNVTAGGTFASSVEDWDGEFGITVSGVSKDVCENLIRMMGDKSTLRAITKTSDEKTDLASGDCASPTNDLFLVYNKDMSAEDSTNSGRSGGSGSSYCSTHECNDTCGIDNVPCAKGAEEKTYDEAVAQCGGEENMFTLEELGCPSITGGFCTNAPSSGEYWVKGFDANVVTALVNEGYTRSVNDFLNDYGYSSVDELVSGFAYYVYDGTLGFDNRNRRDHGYSADPYPLCK